MATGSFSRCATRSARSTWPCAPWRNPATRAINGFQDNIAHGRENQWRCRAGARYLYICEDGLVHYCSQQRGYPGKPLLEYTLDDIRREYRTAKDCAPRCTVACVHQTGYIDSWRDPQNLPVSPVGPSHTAPLVQLQPK